MTVAMGGDLGGWGGDGPSPKFEVGAAHASVLRLPPIFGEVMLLESCESSKREKRCKGEIVFIK